MASYILCPSLAHRLINYTKHLKMHFPAFKFTLKHHWIVYLHKSLEISNTHKSISLAKYRHFFNYSFVNLQSTLIFKNGNKLDVKRFYCVTQLLLGLLVKATQTFFLKFYLVLFLKFKKL